MCIFWNRATKLPVEASKTEQKLKKGYTYNIHALKKIRARIYLCTKFDVLCGTIHHHPNPKLNCQALSLSLLSIASSRKESELTPSTTVS